jgi:hypothetical protein
LGYQWGYQMTFKIEISAHCLRFAIYTDYNEVCSSIVRWCRLRLQSLAPTNPHWARVVGYGLFSLRVIHKEGLCPSSGDLNMLIMMMMIF